MSTGRRLEGGSRKINITPPSESRAEAAQFLGLVVESRLLG